MICRCYDCVNNQEGDCCIVPTISNDTLTAAGYVAICEDYEESDDYVEEE